jgi:hypothetical protein
MGARLFLGKRADKYMARYVAIQEDIIRFFKCLGVKFLHAPRIYYFHPKIKRQGHTGPCLVCPWISVWLNSLSFLQPAKLTSTVTGNIIGVNQSLSRRFSQDGTERYPGLYKKA